MGRITVACIVEGYGDVEAIPILVRRVLQESHPDVSLFIPHPPIRVPRMKIVKDGQLERAVELAARKTDGPGAILILIDADEDCPATLAPELLRRAKAKRSDRPIAVVLAKREFEAWFLAAAESLRGQRGLSATLEPPGNPEMIQDAKGWLRGQMTDNRKYSETLDQPALTRLFDLESARRAASFDKLYRDIARLLSELEQLGPKESPH